MSAKIELVTSRKAPCFIDPRHSVCGASSRLPHLHLLQPQSHAHLAVSRRRGLHDLTGSVKVKVEPFPSSLSTQIRPPWSSMNFRESASPSPVPSTFLSAVPTFRNSSKTAS